MSCGYQGHEFGASYHDSICIDGMLWDADSGDGDGLLSSGGDWACPRCNTVQMLRDALEEAQDGGCGLSMFTPWVAMERWERAIAHARRENAREAEIFLQALPPFLTDDWPDREAVHVQPSLWDQTIEREWRYAPASVGRNAKRQDAEERLGPKDEHAVGSEADETPNPITDPSHD